MLRTSESETEILLGNKQLLGIFLVVAVLLGVSFTGGFLVGRGGGKKSPSSETVASTSVESGSAAASAGGQTHTLGGEAPLAAASGGADSEAATPLTKNQTNAADEAAKGQPEPALGTRKHASAAAIVPVKAPASGVDTAVADSESGYTPVSGAQYLQVAAVGRDEAETVADVLHKKGFAAHAVPKPGNLKIYRVIIGPVTNAGDLSSTRDALRKTFREVIVQRY